MRNDPAVQREMIDLTEIPVERRAERLEHAFRLLSPGDVFWVAGNGDAHHYEQFLHQHFPGEVNWIADYEIEGRWIARVDRS